MRRPLADEIRPQTLDEVVGQKHLLGESAVLRRIIESGTIAQHGLLRPLGHRQDHRGQHHRPADQPDPPPAQRHHRLHLPDIKDIIGRRGHPPGPRRACCCTWMRSSTSTRSSSSPCWSSWRTARSPSSPPPRRTPISTSTAPCSPGPPSSSSRQWTPQEVQPAVERGIAIMEERLGGHASALGGRACAEHIATACGGDVRKAINAVELLCSARPSHGTGKSCASPWTTPGAGGPAQSPCATTGSGDAMYDIASALMKSLRGSDPDAALHYLARLAGGGGPDHRPAAASCAPPARISAWPTPRPCSIVKACVDTAMQLGLPEAQLPLAQAAILLATAPKSNSVPGWASARPGRTCGHGKTGDVPRELQNVHADSAGMEREQGYLYPHSFPGHWVQPAVPARRCHQGRALL